MSTLTEADSVFPNFVIMHVSHRCNSFTHSSRLIWIRCLAATSAATTSTMTPRLARCCGGCRSASTSPTSPRVSTGAPSALGGSAALTSTASSRMPRTSATPSPRSADGERLLLPRQAQGAQHAPPQLPAGGDLRRAHASAQAQDSQGEQQVEAEADGVGGVLDVCCCCKAASILLLARDPLLLCC